jgi:hypothetical protein
MAKGSKQPGPGEGVPLGVVITRDPVVQHQNGLPAVPSDFLQRIRSFEAPADWDGEGALPITQSTCEAAVSLLMALHERFPELPLPRSSPSSLGKISLYWKQGNAHLTILTSEADSYVLRTKTTGELPQESNPDRERLLLEVGRILRLVKAAA